MSTVTIFTCPLNCRNQNLFFPALIIRMDVTKEKIETVQAEKKVREKRRRKFILLALLVLLLVFIVVGDQKSKVHPKSKISHHARRRLIRRRRCEGLQIGRRLARSWRMCLRPLPVWRSTYMSSAEQAVRATYLVGQIIQKRLTTICTN